jgi:hypothetical protein
MPLSFDACAEETHFVSHYHCDIASNFKLTAKGEDTNKENGAKGARSLLQLKPMSVRS